MSILWIFEGDMRPTRAEIDLEAIRHNLKQIRNRVGNTVKILAVVKANAYGHGLVEVSKALVEGKVDYLGVAIIEEGIELREKGIEVPILVFTPPFVNELELFLKYNLDVTLCSKETADALNTLVSNLGGRVNVHIKVDTGMGRLGIGHHDAGEFVKYVATLRSIHIQGIYTHFSTSDERDKEFTNLQLIRFRYVVASLKNIGIDIPLKHCANSGAILDLKDCFFDMVRPGIMIYGYYPSHETSESINLRQAMSLKSKIDFLKVVRAGSAISYGRKYIAKSDTKIASVPLGYADGYSRLLTNKAEVLIHGKRYPVVGTVCMDHVMIDLGMNSDVALGDEVVFIGNDGNESITAWEISDKLGTIPYEVCCGISERVPRVFK